MRFMVPTAIRGPAEAFRMTQEGYVDNRGNKLPMEPKAQEILMQALGLTPARKAEYSEANLKQSQRRGDLTQRASVIRSKLARAVEQQNAENFKAAMQEARAFDRSNPAYGVVRSLSETIRRRERARQQAQLTNNPLRVNVRDQGARALTQYANY
jgi:hypothetical protein